MNQGMDRRTALGLGFMGLTAAAFSKTAWADTVSRMNAWTSAWSDSPGAASFWVTSFWADSLITLLVKNSGRQPAPRYTFNPRQIPQAGNVPEPLGVEQGPNSGRLVETMFHTKRPAG